MGANLLPVPCVELLADGSFVKPVPGMSTLNSVNSGWAGIGLESYCDVPGCDIAEHVHPTHFLNLLTGAPVRAEWTTEGKTYRAINEPGNIYLLPRGTRDKLTWKDSSSHIIVAIDAGFLCRSVPETSHLDDVELIPHWELKDRHIAALMTALHADLEDGQAAGRLYGEMLGASLASYLVNRYAVHPPQAKTPMGGLPRARLKRTFEFIDQHLATNIAMADLAGVANMSVSHFSEQFRLSTGTSPHRFVLQRRIDRAKHLLRETDLSLVEVALASGFADQSHFAKTFRRSVRMTPRQFRLSN